MAELESPVFPVCVHRWRIAAPVGGLCRGACSICGAERCFTNARFPFGRPGRAKKVAPHLRTVLLPHAPPALHPSPGQSGCADLCGPAGMNAFLLQHRAQLNEIALQE